MASAPDDGRKQVRAALLDADGLVRAVASGRRRGAEPRWRRVELRYVDLKAGRRLQVTSYDDTQAFTANHSADEAGRVVDELLDEGFGSWHVETTAQTGVEMEALTAVAVAALTIYDMVKAVDKAMVIGDIRLMFKSGGRTGTYRRRREGGKGRRDRKGSKGGI